MSTDGRTGEREEEQHRVRVTTGNGNGARRTYGGQVGKTGNNTRNKRKHNGLVPA